MRLDSPAIAMDKVPPQNIEAEQSTLGSMMIDRAALDLGLEKLKAYDFYRPGHQVIFAALGELRRNNEPADLITLQEELRKRNKLEDVGGTDYLMALVDTVPTAANIEHYVGIVEIKSVLRKLISTGTAITSMGYQETADIEELLTQAERMIMRIGQNRSGNNFKWMEDVYNRVYNQLPRISEEFGVPIGLKPLADKCVKFMAGESIVIGARPSVGKSALAYQLLEYAASHGHMAGMISGEMTDEQFALRQFAGSADVDISVILKGNLQAVHYDRIAKSAAALSRKPVAFHNAVGQKMAQIKAECRRMYSAGIRIIAIDHIHCITPDNPRASRAAQLGQISADCKAIALELNIPVLALAQLSREHVKKNKDARPTMSDLKESGDIEANADTILLLWRPSADCEKRSYGVTKAEIIIAKNRQLGTGVVHCGFFGRRFQFVDMADYQLDDNQATRDETVNYLPAEEM